MPNSDWYLDNYWKHLKEGQTPLAKISLLKAMVKSPKEARLYYEWARLYLLSYKLREALEALEMADRLENNYRDSKQMIRILQHKISQSPMSVYQ